LGIASKRSAVRVESFRVQPLGCHRCADTGKPKREEERTRNGHGEARTLNRHAKAKRREKKSEKERRRVKKREEERKREKKREEERTPNGHAEA
jgi:hypothetical protein